MSINRLWAIFLSGFMVLGGYEFARSASISLFQVHYGSAATAYLLILVPLLSFALLYIYGRLLTLYGPQKTFFITTLMSAMTLATLKWMIDLGFHPARVLLFVFRESYIVLLIEQHWALIDSILEQKQAKKINSLFLGFASIGAIGASLTVGYFAQSIGTSNMVLGAVFTLLPCLYFGYRAYEDNPSALVLQNEERSPELKSLKGNLGFKYFKKFPILVLILGMVLVSQFLATSLGLQFQDVLNRTVPELDKQTAFSGNFYAAMNTLSAVFQFFLAPILLTRLPMKWVLAGIPVVHFCLCAFALVVPSIWSVGLAFMIFKSVDYSLFKSAKEVLFIPLPFDAKYRSKGLIDVIGYRTSKGAGSLLFSTLKASGVAISGVYGWVSLICTVVWLSFVPKILKQPKSL